MPWIYFSRDEPPAPSIKLATLDGKLLEPSDFRGTTSLVLFFSHGQDCVSCSSLVRELAAVSGGLRSQDVRILAITPVLPAGLVPGLSHIQILLDRQGLLRRAYASIFEFDVDQNAMLFILNQYGAPFRAWVGDQPDSDVMPQMLKYLESAALFCPE